MWGMQGGGGGAPVAGFSQTNTPPSLGAIRRPETPHLQPAAVFFQYLLWVVDVNVAT